MLGGWKSLRLLKINYILFRFCLVPSVLQNQPAWVQSLSYLNPWGYLKPAHSRGQAIRLALEQLGPIFIKFGQMLSTRPDVLKPDIIEELEKLQDQVPAFPGQLAITLIEQNFLRTINELFHFFNEEPLASASIAQVHEAILLDGSHVVVKIVRPNIVSVIQKDIAILYSIARLLERFWMYGKRLHLIDMVAEFEQTIFDELDLMREAASASQLRRNFQNSEMMYVPKIYWNYVNKNIMVQERIKGIRISNIAELQRRHTNMKKLAENGVEIFFTQVFRDNFFHADMHPGNLFVDVTDPRNPKYIGIDFGIMGSLSAFDQCYLAQNLMAFFNRDYRRVALLHVESGWVPPDTRVEQMEAAIRTVCEPIFERSLHEISFGKLLLQLFMTAERFNMEIQPQLMLLQKTLVSIEGLGRQLYPELNLWDTAKPFMRRFISQRYGGKNTLKSVMQNWPEMSDQFISLPKIAANVLCQVQKNLAQAPVLTEKKQRQKRRQRKKRVWSGLGIGLIVILLGSKIPASMVWLSAHSIVLMILGIFCLMIAWSIEN